MVKRIIFEPAGADSDGSFNIKVTVEFESQEKQMGLLNADFIKSLRKKLKKGEATSINF